MTGNREKGPRKSITILLGLLLVLVLLSFLPVLDADFLNWDDDVYVTNNPLIRELSPASLRTIFTSTYGLLYHPFTLLSYALEYHFFGLKPFFYHFDNLLIHALNSLLVFLFIFKLSGKRTAAFITSLLFALHPLHVESVAWISERKDVLCTFFFLLTLLCYLYYMDRRNPRLYYLSVAFFIISLLSKPMGVTMPLILMLLDSYLQLKPDRKSMAEKLPFFIVALIVTLFTAHIISNGTGKFSARGILVASYGILFYLGRFIVPVNLSAYYPYPDRDMTTIPLFIAAPAILLILSVLVAFSRRYTAKIMFGSLFFLITILPVLQVIKNTNTITADRYTYIPSIGLFFILGEGFCRIYQKYSHNWIRSLLLAALVAVTGLLCHLTHERCKVWDNSLVFWNHMIAQYQNIPDAYYNRGKFFEEKGEYAKALEDYDRAIAIAADPRYHTNRGNIHYMMRDYDRAIKDYNRAILLNPSSPKAYTCRGNAYLDRGEPDRALKDYNQALAVDPAYPEAFNNRGTFYGSRKEYDRAISDFTKALAISPLYGQAYFNRAITYKSMKEYKKALEDLLKVQSLGYQVDSGLLREMQDRVQEHQ